MSKEMLSWEQTRRMFLKTTAATAALVAASGELGPFSTLVESEAAETKKTQETAIPTVCGVCHLGCGAIVYVKDGRITRTTGRPGHVQDNRCARGNATVQHVYSPDRLKYPLKRVGKRGEGKFKRITWDEALDTIANKMKEIKEKYGAEQFAVLSGRASFADHYTWNSWYSPPFFHLYGTPNTGGVGSVCWTSYGMLAHIVTYGRVTGTDIDNTNLIMLWGGNPPASYQKEPVGLVGALAGPNIINAIQRGAKLVVIDPRLTDLAAKADLWVPIRHGTDGALALGMLRYIINEGLYDKDFVRDWTIGFDQLKEYVQQWTPEKVSKITWVPEDKIIKAAHIYATTKPACISLHTGLEYCGPGFQAIRAVYIMRSICGNLDVKGGDIWGMPGFPLRPIKTFPRPAVKPIGYDEFKMFVELQGPLQMQTNCLPKAVLEGKPYPVRGIIIWANAPTSTSADSKLWEKTLKSLDFLAVIDRIMTNEASWADIVLPACTYYEREGAAVGPIIGYPDRMYLMRKCIEPLGEAWPDTEIWLQLAKKLGFGEHYPFKTYKDYINYLLEPSGFTLEKVAQNEEGIGVVKPAEQQYKKYEAKGFSTPSGKCEITSSLMKKYGYNELPVYTEPRESPLSRPDLAAKYPLVLSTGSRQHGDFHSQFHNLPWLLDFQGAPSVWINTKDARERGIKDGDNVIVETVRDSAPFVAKVTERIIPGAVDVYHGGGQRYNPPAWRKGNANLLTDNENLDPVSGFPTYKALLCNVRKA